MCHLLDAMVKGVFEIDAIKDLFDRQTTIVKHVKKSTLASKKLKKIQEDIHKAVPNRLAAHHETLGWKKKYPKKPISLTLAVKTRWWSKIKQNKRFIRLEPAVVDLLNDLLEDDQVKEKVKVAADFSQSDWKVMETFTDIFAPFKDAIKQFEGTL